MDIGGDVERIRDYLVGRLSEDERNAFEERLAREPSLMRELEHTLQMREGLMELRDKGELVTHIPRVKSWQSWFPTLAAAAIAALALYVLVDRSAAPSPVLLASVEAATGTAAPDITAHFTFMAMRGDFEPLLELPAQGFVEFRVKPANRTDGAVYRGTLRLDDNRATKPVGEMGGLSRAADEYVHLYAEAARLAAGRYVLRIDEPATDSVGSFEEFRFTLRKSAAE